MELGLCGKVALVTGAGAGIGAAIARKLAAEGCMTYLADLDETVARQTAREIELNGHRARALAMDVADPASVEAAFSQVSEDGGVEILVNNAGILKTGPISAASLADWEQLSRVNVGGVISCSAVALPGMVERRRGKIVNLSSVSAIKGGGSVGNAFYGASKAAVSALTKGYAREYGPHGITVNAIAPAVARTPMTASSLQASEVEQRIAASIPLGRIANAEEIASLLAFLVSDVVGYINGAVIPIDGGLLTV